MIDPYAVLGVQKQATQEQIKAAYRKLAKKLHPDLNPGNKAVETRFKEVNKAYELIGTPEARARFDRGETQEQQERAWQARYGAGKQRGPFYYETQEGPGSRYTQSFGDINPEMFANIFGGGFEDLFGGRKTDRARPSRDQQFSLNVDFKTAVLGGEKTITLPSGKTLQVKIPPGVKTGTKLRLAGQAEASPGMPPGDAYIEINVTPSETFKRVGADLEMELPLSLSEAVLGGQVKVPTIDGNVLLTIPPGVSTGARLRIRGKGVPTKAGRGDQFAVVKVVMPRQVDSELREAIQKWSRAHQYNPREERHV